MSATPSNASGNAATTPGCSPTDQTPAPPVGPLCAVHQPNLFPRLSTLAKLYAADFWVVLNDVQFARRDYQQRARLGSLLDPKHRQWLTLPTHLPHGRPTLIREARIVDPARSRRKLLLSLQQHYGTSRHWTCLSEALPPLLDLMENTDSTAEIAEASTRLLLDLLGWQGRIVRSDALPARTGRSERLADLAASMGAGTYLCGTGGMRYLRPAPFAAQGIGVIPFRTPTAGGAWSGAREISTLWALMTYGPDSLSALMRRQQVPVP
ncbi:WbqC family protein [Streptomyces sp. Ncost-T6T-1]|uniref:WbqC family protein n=1 Tax=Streptomyces sp. Ncost-T6T-1 TaxID=1100828 RepID=UPI000B8153BA